jgi:hypothetical protein
VAQGHDPLDLIRVALGEDGRFGGHATAGLAHDVSHAVERAAGRDHVVDEDDVLPLDKSAILLVEMEGLGMTGRDGYRLRLDGVAHVWLVLLPEHDPGLAHLARQLVHERNALRLRGHDCLCVDGGEAPGKACGRRLDDLRVTEQVEDRDPQTGSHLEQRKISLDPFDLHPVRVSPAAGHRGRSLSRRVGRRPGQSTPSDPPTTSSP